MIREAATESVLGALLDQVREVSEDLARARRINTSGVPSDRAALTVREVANLLQVAPETVREWFYAGKVEGLQTGNRILIWRWSLLELMGLPVTEKKWARH